MSLQGKMKDIYRQLILFFILLMLIGLGIFIGHVQENLLEDVWFGCDEFCFHNNFSMSVPVGFSYNFENKIFVCECSNGGRGWFS